MLFQVNAMTLFCSPPANGAVDLCRRNAKHDCKECSHKELARHLKMGSEEGIKWHDNSEVYSDRR
ncbi:hypothetical protein SAMN06265348_12618 [Pedobacter westerhofensis]|uniref:Uncharacterized protein n=1 Tax=Pedobacter westerhofensis TaxID=425512 RepID=A0A521FUC3_9SPHI|nr:hypothetical protein SAMN06265348_12618 [Pedobacter westerhofensis]